MFVLCTFTFKGVDRELYEFIISKLESGNNNSQRDDTLNRLMFTAERTSITTRSAAKNAPVLCTFCVFISLNTKQPKNVILTSDSSLNLFCFCTCLWSESRQHKKSWVQKLVEWFLTSLTFPSCRPRFWCSQSFSHPNLTAPQTYSDCQQPLPTYLLEKRRKAQNIPFAVYVTWGSIRQAPLLAFLISAFKDLNVLNKLRHLLAI